MAHQPGVYTALVTPFDENGKLDLASLERLTQDQVDAGVAGVCALGGTGEPSALTLEERIQVISCVTGVVRNNVPVVVGALVGSFAEMSAVIGAAASSGAASIMLMPPTFVGPDQRTVRAHFVALAGQTALPIILFNTPTRSGVRLDAARIEDVLEAAPTVVAIKEATGDIDLAAYLMSEHADRLEFFQGYESLILSSMILGAQGCFISGSNLLPALFTEIDTLCTQGDWEAARILHTRCLPLMRAIYSEPNPGPLKYALAKAGLISTSVVRRPLIDPAPETVASLDALLDNIALLQPASR